MDQSYQTTQGVLKRLKHLQGKPFKKGWSGDVDGLVGGCGWFGWGMWGFLYSN